MSLKTRDGKTHQSSVLVGENGLPIDGIATISGSYIFLTGPETLTYSPGGATVTLPVGYDLTPVTTAKARYTGRYILLTNDSQIYYIDRSSIDVVARTFSISKSDKIAITPASIDLSGGWTIAEADIVNRLATTSAAKIENVEFKDLHFQLQIDGDPVTVVDKDGELVDFATEATQLDNNQELKLINDELDSVTINLAQIDDSVNKSYVAQPTILNPSLPLANLAYTLTIPASAKRYLIRSRDSLSKIKVRFSNTDPYITVSPGSMYSEEGLDLASDLLIYVESSRADNILELLYWT